jgi:SAM-dependent methyltransferase
MEERMTTTMRALSPADIDALDPYLFMAVLGKRVIHPGGRQASEELLRQANIQAGQNVLDVGCGVATTAIEIARRHGARVTAVDIAPLMIERARANVAQLHLQEQVIVQAGDILALDFADGSFDCVVAEAVTMFVDRPRAARELVRVCRPAGRVLATEFLWRRPPPPEVQHLFLGEICPGLTFDNLDEWVQLYGEAGLDNIQVASGPFEMMTPGGFLSDEGLPNSLAILIRACGHGAYLKKMAWLMPRMMRVAPYLGYIVVTGVKPSEER